VAPSGGPASRPSNFDDFCYVFFDHFGLAHMSDHFALVGSDEVGLFEPNDVNVLLMLFSIDPNQLITLNSFKFVI
jgi:hypothetical protein